MTPIYYIKNGKLYFADKVLFSSLELYIYAGDKICLIGRNGCGKSSLMKVISGDYELDSGEVFHDPSTTISYLNQNIRPGINMSVYEFVLQGLNTHQLDQYKIDIILDKLQLDKNSNLSNCSGGQIRRAHLAKALVSKPDILLLDEPTNHLDIGTIEWLEEYVKSYSGAIICISHDKAFLTNVTNKLWWLDRGHLRVSDKGFKYFDEWQTVVIEQEESILRKLNKKLDNENDWLNAGVTARRKRNQKRLADLKALKDTVKQHANTLAITQQKIQTAKSADISKSQFIIEAESVSFNYSSANIINNFSFRVKKGEKIGIVGPNGSGKTTLVKLLLKQTQPTSGIITHGQGLKISYFDQHRTELNPESTLQQILCPTGGDQVFLSDKTMHVAGYLKQFMFDPKLLTAKVSTLSGGEANRLLLAKTLINPGNLLILDEPTNDLDMDSLEILLDILSDYRGTLILISHDRDFLNKLVTRSFIFTSGRIVDIAGSYDDYKQSGPKIDTPKITKSSPTPTPNEKAKSQKLTYKAQRLLETIPLEIEKLETEIKELESLLNDPTLYSSNPDKFQKVSETLALNKQKLDSLLTEWLELSA